jgi:hypothetical protein
MEVLAMSIDPPSAASPPKEPSKEGGIGSSQAGPLINPVGRDVCEKWRKLCVDLASPEPDLIEEAKAAPESELPSQLPARGMIKI